MGIEVLKRKFEDNEADIISEIYSTHFRAKLDDGTPNIGQDDGTNTFLGLEKNNIEYDSIEDNEPTQMNDSGIKSTLGPAPDVNTYTKPLQDQIKYVQYIPKTAKGTIEDAVNQLYMDDQVRQNFDAQRSGLDHVIKSTKKKP